MSKHTPGLWFVQEDADGEVTVTSRKYGRICELTLGTQLDNAVANAHLIAAAPELLDVLTELVKTVYSKNKDEWIVAISDAENAIKNAKGEA